MPDARPPAVCDEADLIGTFTALPNVVSATEETCGEYIASPARCFKLFFRQPVQHATNDGNTFDQLLELVHRGCDKPMVVADWGYESFNVFWESELSGQWQTNAINVEHRFQGQSLPTTWDWTGLTIANGAADQHAVIDTLRRMYGGPWISTGASKGGITAIYHRYLYPGDLDGTVAYVAPASHNRKDVAYQDYMAATLPACGAHYRAYQVDALTARRDAGIARYGNLETLEQMFWFADWGFWQYGGVDACDQIPTSLSSDEEFFGFVEAGPQLKLAPAPGLDARSEWALAYEWMTEQGFADQVNNDVRSLLEYPDWTYEWYLSYYQPELVVPPFDGSITDGVRTWIPSAEDMVLIYGQYDPWSGGQLDAPTGTGSGKFVAPAANHGANISQLAPADFDEAVDLVSAMMGIRPVAGKARPGAWTHDVPLTHEHNVMQRMLTKRPTRDRP